MATKDDETDVDDDATIPEASQDDKRVYKSWRKKYRKMRYLFDEGMQESAALFKQEHKTWGIARRLQEQNDQLLDLILEVNDSVITPSHLRYQLGSPPPRLSAVPELESDHSDDVSKGDEPSATEGIFLASLESQATFTPYNLATPAVMPTDLQDLEGTLPPSYLTSEHEEKYALALDADIIGSNAIGYPSDDEAAQNSPKPDPKEPSDRDMALDNPVSVHNWLRKHQPQVFETTEKMTKSTPERMNSRKKEKLAREEPLDPLDEEIGFDPRYEYYSTSGRGKRKKDDDAYRPKGGSSRAYKRKRDKDDAENKVAKKPRKSGLSNKISDHD